LETYDAACSPGRRVGICNGTLKQETSIARFILEDCPAVEIAMLDWIDGWYNSNRRHTTLGGCSPIEFEAKMAA